MRDTQHNPASQLISLNPQHTLSFLSSCTKHNLLGLFSSAICKPLGLSSSTTHKPLIFFLLHHTQPTQSHLYHHTTTLSSSLSKPTQYIVKRPKRRNNVKRTHINNEKQCYWGCSTSLKLYENPWKIKKVLTKSDIGNLNRLLFRAELLKKLMLPVLDADAQPQRDAMNGMGCPVRVCNLTPCLCTPSFSNVGLLSRTLF